MSIGGRIDYICIGRDLLSVREAPQPEQVQGLIHCILGSKSLLAEVSHSYVDERHTDGEDISHRLGDRNS